MENIKINGSDKDVTSLSQNSKNQTTQDIELTQPAEFIVDTEILNKSDSPQVRVINNLS